MSCRADEGESEPTARPSEQVYACVCSAVSAACPGPCAYVQRRDGWGMCGGRKRAQCGCVSDIEEQRQGVM